MCKALCLAAAVFLGLTSSLPGVDEEKGKNLLARAAVRPSLPQLIEQMGDRRYRVRALAQRLIEEMDDGVALPVLIKARQAAKDSEVARRLDIMIPVMERSALLKARLVSLHVNKRTLQDIAAELTRQSGYGIDIQNASAETFTFNFDNVPFWDALDRVCRAAKLNIQASNYWDGTNGRIQLNSYGGQASPFICYAQAFRLTAQNFHLQRFVNFAGPADAKPPPHTRSETLTLNFTIQSEPKLPIAQVLNPIISEAYDENKKPMAIRTVVTTALYYDERFGPRHGYGYRTFSLPAQVNLLRPTRDSKMAKLIKGEVPLVLTQEVPEFVVEQPLAVKKKKLKKSITEIEIEDMTEGNWGNGKSYNLKVSVKEESQMTYNDYNWLNTLPVHFDLIDAKGNKYTPQNQGFNSLGPRSGKGTIMFIPQGNVALGPPVRLVYYKWIPINHTIKFELHNVPLP